MASIRAVGRERSRCIWILDSAHPCCGAGPPHRRRLGSQVREQHHANGPGNATGCEDLQRNPVISIA